MIFIKAFVVGGLICVIGQIILDKTKITMARILVLFVVLGVVLQAIHQIADLVFGSIVGLDCGCITGFGVVFQTDFIDFFAIDH